MDGYRLYRRQILALAGHALIETAVVLSVVGIMASFALPPLRDFLREQRLRTWSNTLVGDLHLARSESIKRGVPIVMCRTRDGRSCHRHRGFRSDWGRGWILYVNVDDDTHRDPAEPLLLHRRGPPPGMSLYFNQRWRITFRPDGRAKNGSFTLCASQHDRVGRAVILYMTGRPRTARKTASGGPLDCGGA